MLAIYDAAAPGEDVAQLRSAGVGADRLEQVAAILDPAAEDRPRQNAHYGPRRATGLAGGGDAAVREWQVPRRPRHPKPVAGHPAGGPGYHAQPCSPGLRQQLEGAGFTRPAPYIIPESFSVLQRSGNGGKRLRRRSAPVPAPEAAAAPPPVVEEPPAEAPAAPTRRGRATKPPAEIPEVTASPAEEVTEIAAAT